MRRKIAIIGAGVGGILMIAKLLDASIRPHHIVWIDPYFNVGRIGDKYRTVESNDEVWEWHDVLKKYKCLSKYTKLLEGYDHHRNENLSVIADVLAQITQDFRSSSNYMYSRLCHEDAVCKKTPLYQMETIFPEVRRDSSKSCYSVNRKSS